MKEGLLRNGWCDPSSSTVQNAVFSIALNSQGCRGRLAHSALVHKMTKMLVRCHFYFF